MRLSYKLRVNAALYENRKPMASKFKCDCGLVIRTNLYEGHENYLLVPEVLTDVESSADLDAVLSSIILNSKKVAFCSNCKKLHVIDNTYNIASYESVDRSWSVWRQDDNGNEIRMASQLKETEALAIVEEFESRGHKQIYWVKQE